MQKEYEEKISQITLEKDNLVQKNNELKEGQFIDEEEESKSHDAV